MGGFAGSLLRGLGQTGSDIGTAKTNIAAQKAQQQKDQLDALTANLRMQQMRQQMAAQTPEAQQKLYQSQLDAQSNSRFNDAVRQHALEAGWSSEEANQRLSFIQQGKTPEEQDMRASVMGIKMPSQNSKPVLRQDFNSTTGYSWDYGDGRVTPGAPPPKQNADPMALEKLRQQGRMQLAQYRAGVSQALAKLRNPTGTSPQQWQALNHDPGYIDGNRKLSQADTEIRRLSDILATGKDPTGKTLLGGAELTPEKAQQIQSQVEQQQAAAQDALKEMERIRNKIVYGGSAGVSSGTRPRPKGVPDDAVWDENTRTWSAPQVNTVTAQ